MIDFSELLSQDVGKCLNLIKKSKNSKNKNKLREELNNLIENSKKELELRKLNLPKNLNFDFDLPVLEKRAEIEKIIAENQIIIISGETGSGKTTQIPKICLSLGLGARGIIGHTQPRRIAAKSTAARIAYELGEDLGQSVGYQVRFDEKLSDKTAIKLMTDGILLAEIQEDKFLNKYEVIIIDEAHERSLNIDFLLGYLKTIAQKRKDLKIIITSATIDSEKFSKHFNNAPIINVSGRTYPVEIFYREPKEDLDLANSVLEAVLELDSYFALGDILVFLATEREIREVADFLKKSELKNSDILPLFGRLSLADQQRVFYPQDRRRIVLATNVAETSLTVPRIKFVIDTGKARLSRYSLRTKTQRLPIEPISKASANQRAGRCGRLSEGICLRLYSEEDFNNRPDFTEPEILRTNLASVILQMLVLNLGEIGNFPFVDKPEDKQINDGYRLLFELKAVDENKKLSEIGRKMAKLPLDPRFSRIIFEAEKNGVLFEAIIVLSALSIQDPRERPFGAEAIADQRQGEFADKNSDFQSLLNLFSSFQERGRELSNNQLRKWCQHYFLNFLRMREWRELVNQLVRECRAEKLKINELKFPKNRLLTENLAEGSKGSLGFNNPNLELLHRSLMVGFLDMVGLWDEVNKEYQGTRGRKFSIFPASVLAKQRPQALMAASILETSKTYALNCCQIELSQIEPLATHLSKSHLINPHWSKKMGNVMAEESILLYGLPLISGRRKPFNKDPKLAQEIFIHEALITGEINTKIKEISLNIELFNELENLEDKTRSRGILVNEEDLAQFYFQRLPESVYSTVSLEQWVKENPQHNLLMKKEDLIAQNPEISAQDYPEFLVLKGHKIKLEYLFNPSAEEDGITAIIPLYALNALEAQDFERLVPALLQEKIEEILRHLPKVWRRQLVPIPDFARAVYERIVEDKKPLFISIAENIYQMKGLKIPLEDLENAEIPAHLMMNYRLIDEKKEILAQSRDLSFLQGEFSKKASLDFLNQSKSKLADGEIVKDFIWEKLPEKEIMKGGVVGYPALTFENGVLSLKLHDNPHLAKTAHRRGLRKLLEEKLSSQIKYLKKNIPELNKMSLFYRKITADLHLSDDIVAALINRVCLKNGVPKTKQDFEIALQLGEKNLISEANNLCKLLLEILSLYSEINEKLRKLKGIAKEDIKKQLDSLIFPNFIKNTPAEKMSDVLRYLKAIVIRIEKIKQEPLKDLQRINEIRLWQEKLDKFKLEVENGREDKREQFINCFYALEEFRVQIFAQNLGTKIKISPEKLKKLFDN